MFEFKGHCDSNFYCHWYHTLILLVLTPLEYAISLNGGVGGHEPAVPIISLIEDVSTLKFGNSTTSDYLKLLELDGDHLLIGARDVVYNISIDQFIESQSIKWQSKENVVNECQMKGKPKEACHNFIRVLSKDVSSNDVLVCGTNAYQPLCRRYDFDRYGGYRQHIEFSGLGLTPYDPNHNSTFLRDNDLLYAGTVSDFTGIDPLVHRRNITKLVDLGIRTERNDVKLLNEPHFVGSFKDVEYIYIWFRERSVEQQLYDDNKMHSRVARLCRSDQGGPRPYTNEWTSFVKARLNCSVPGLYPFYFDQLESVASPVSGVYSSDSDVTQQLVYAVFGTPLAGLSGSAICAFSIQQISEVFDKSTYSMPNNAQTMWLSTVNEQHYRPGRCVNDSRNLSEEAVALMRSTPLADAAVQNFFAAPIAIHSGDHQFTQIAIDPQVKAIDGTNYDVIYVGTNRGSIFKLVNLAANFAQFRTQQPIASHHVYSFNVTNEPIRNLMLYTGNLANKYLIAVSDRSVVRVAIEQCARFDTCNRCVALRDPHCAWDIIEHRCTHLNVTSPFRHFEQNIVTGFSEHCAEHEHESLLGKHSYDRNSIDENNVFDAPKLLASSSDCLCSEQKSPPPLSKSTESGIIAESSKDGRRSLGDSLSVSILCSAIAALATLFGIVLSSLYWRCRRAPSKDNLSSCPSFSIKPQAVYTGRSPSSTIPITVINAYDSTPKFQSLSIMQRDSSIISPDVLGTESAMQELKLPDSSSWSRPMLPSVYHVKQMYL